MIRKTLALGLVAAMLSFAAPAAAQDFDGPRVGVELGVVGDDFADTDKATYGVNAGYDFDLGGAVIGATVSYTGLFDDNGTDLREIAVGARAGAKAGDKTLIYATGAYSNLDTNFGDIDGYRVGLGVERSFGNVFANVETRYGNYEAGVEIYQTVVGIGYRF